MRVIGLTGGIASGKSTAARILTELGARVVDADAVARDIVAPGQPALAEIAKTFGAEMIQRDGTLDRKRL
ncbi:MAG TPA: dephospho-CoA kinase, partial [Polyangia bacterium]